MSVPLPETHKAVRLYPADLSIHVESIPTPKIEHPDDAIVKVKVCVFIGSDSIKDSNISLGLQLSGLCGSDLHGYRGHEKINNIVVTGHEFIGEVVALGSSYSPDATDRPPLYSTLHIGDKVVSPFTSSCAECHFCRIGFTSRCAHQLLFGSEELSGGQAQYVCVPRAGGTLFIVALAPSSSAPSATSVPQQSQPLSNLTDSSLLLLADILPTGVFAALQALQHPNILPVIRGERFPLASVGGLVFPRDKCESMVESASGEGTGGLRDLLLDSLWPGMGSEDRVLTIAVIGLGPVGVCATIALLDFLSALRVRYRLVAIDTVEARRENILAVYDALPASVRNRDSEFAVDSPDNAIRFVQDSTDGIGCNAVLESPLVCIRRPPVPFTGRELYAKNVAAVFGRCPVRAVFPLAADLLRRRQDVFGGVGSGAGAGVERIVGLDNAPEAYAKFAKNEWGKVAFDPWN
ncbi:hypothetical protein EW145_g6052 [Phellinidium pouzarii]|uniref:Alcohol dehydrogenase-like N-terminal domain-containing protein n=1 Tax=Phellinidium pouzarii TaxID=167371 RepID=A0A4S4KZ28_9AGAM|nr:hypothetical protein EW145_g6052 [Phellinidium pouzarii]